MTSPRLAACVAAAIIALPSAATAQRQYEFTEMHMGMPVRIVLYARNERVAAASARAAFAHIASLESRLSDYRVDSELRRLEHRPREWVLVSEPLYRVLERAIEIARATGGAFDPTIGPLTGLWREARRAHELPSRAAIDSARNLGGWRHLSLNGVRRVRLAKSGMRFDLGGIAKGFVLQSTAELLRSRGITRVLLEAGGDIVVGDAPPGRPGWRIEVPGADSALARRAVQIVRAAVSTSGPSEQFLEIEGVRYSHVIDPRTGRALTSSDHATVIGPDGAIADALATALPILDASSRALLLARYRDYTASLYQRP
jgi:FAD:protein FMN transferase